MANMLSVRVSGESVEEKYTVCSASRYHLKYRLLRKKRLKTLFKVALPTLVQCPQVLAAVDIRFVPFLHASRFHRPDCDLDHDSAEREMFGSASLPAQLCRVTRRLRMG